jgi:phosphoglycolate phosphatase/pyrophosphatase PpaX
MRRLRPHLEPVSLDGWFRKNFHPGIMSFLVDVLELSPEEIQIEYQMWQDCNREQTPTFFEGFIDVLREFRGRGGHVTVVSHSEAENISRHYRAAGFQPDMILGWEEAPERRKPNPWPVLTILQRLALAPSQALVLDDLKPGVVMARAAGVPVAASGWGHQIDEIQQYMSEACDAYLPTVSDFRDYVLD